MYSKPQMNVEENIPRYEEPNPFNYDALELAKRKKAVNDAVKDYPNLPPLWIEWMYDLIRQKPVDEVRRIIINREWETAPKERTQAGSIICMTIE